VHREFAQFDLESELAIEVAQHKLSRLKVFDGITDSMIRMKRFRKAIIALKIGDRLMGETRKTYSQYFERCYGEPLILEEARHERSHGKDRCTDSRSADHDRNAVAKQAV
jgi:hypothetical protein